MKFPRTPHIPGSHGTSDDLMLSSFSLESEVIATEKMDGSNIMMNNQKFVTRKGETSYADWTYPARKVWENIFYTIPDGYWIAGELLTWRKCIAYDNLPGDFLAFSVIKDNMILDWDSAEKIINLVGLPLVPVIARGDYDSVHKKCHEWMNDTHEGFVIRSTGSFDIENYGDHVAKFVGDHHTPVEFNNGKNTIVTE